MYRATWAMLAAFFLIVGSVYGAEKPAGNWNLKIKVGHVGEGIRMVVLQIRETNGKFDAVMSKLNGKLDTVDEVSYKNGLMTIAQGAYAYALRFEGDTLKGKVVSPAGEQTVSGIRQDSIRLMGDETAPLHRAWRGKIERRDNEYLLITRSYELQFSNAEVFKADLEKNADKEVDMSGWWVKTKIRIEKINPVTSGN
ncbi:MAG: hypothetical protein FJY97_11660 [candidate division Zixibacteria bacterium]|nr:hypothetical protein [candidate division Zixibacteria bacterium]